PDPPQLHAVRDAGDGRNRPAFRCPVRSEQPGKLRRPSAIFPSTARRWADERHITRPLHHKVVLAADENALDLVSCGAEHRGTRITTVSVQVGHEKRSRLT